MSKTFREGYYEDEGWRKEKIGKTSKQKRQKVKDYLKQIEFEELDEEDELDFEELI